MRAVFEAALARATGTSTTGAVAAGGQARMNALETTGLGKRYGRVWALRDCTLAVPAGSVTALMGPNGAGKTTLLHLAVGLLTPTLGEVRIAGRRLTGRGRDLGRVAFVAQDKPLFPTFTVDEDPPLWTGNQPRLRPRGGPVAARRP